jgi:hypothetical protein
MSNACAVTLDLDTRLRGNESHVILLDIY